MCPALAQHWLRSHTGRVLPAWGEGGSSSDQDGLWRRQEPGSGSQAGHELLPLGGAALIPFPGGATILQVQIWAVLSGCLQLTFLTLPCTAACANLGLDAAQAGLLQLKLN